LPPQDFRGDYNNTTQVVTLTWVAPDTGAYTYHIYRNKQEIATTADTTFSEVYTATIGPGVAYYARAQPEGMSMQGSPSQPFVMGADVGLVDGPIQLVEALVVPGPVIHYELEVFGNGKTGPCEPIHTTGDIDWDCIEGWLHPGG
jgi:hypothetical protein